MIARVSLVMLVLLGGTIAGARAETGFAACRQQVDDDPEAVEGYLCFRRAGRSSGDLKAALGELSRLEAMRGPRPELIFARGSILADLGDSRALAELEAAADGCRATSSGRCEVLARLELTSRRKAWDPEGSAAELARAGEVANLLKDADLSRRVRIVSAWRHIDDDRPARASTELATLLSEAEIDGSLETRAAILEGLGIAAWSTGRLRDSRDHFRSLLDLADRDGDAWLAARASASFTLLDLQVESPQPETVRERVALAVDAAHRASNPIAELKLRVIYAQTLGGEEATNEWQRVGRMARQFSAVEDELLALRMLARHRMRAGDAPGAIAAMDEAQEVAKASGFRDAEIRGCSGGIELRWADGRLAEAREQLDTCLDLIEKLRDRQALPTDKARVVTRFTHISRHAIDALLGFEDDIDGALQVLERFRARSLEQGIVGETGVMSAEQAELRRRVTRVQLELAYGRPEAGRRRELEVDLERLEAEELRLARASAAATQPSEETQIAQIEQLLDDGEALVAFSMLRYPTDLWQTTGCWAIVVTRDSSRAVRLPSFETIGPAIDALAGLLGRSDQVARMAAARVHELLFREVSDELGRARHLVVLLDEPLHELPLAALRPTAEDAPLVSRFDIQLIPSLGAWQRWRQQRNEDAPPGVSVVVANPRLSSAEDSAFRDAELPTVAELGRLPGAASEGDTIARLLGPGTRLLVADSASEAALRTALTIRPRVLHIAAHAIVDSNRPGRSAIVLAPGNGHDGLLQARDIAGLTLDGSLVVLSACRSLDGEVVDGGGIVSLGSAFLSAGARAVVGAVRPLDDRRVPELMREFYRELEHGAPVARALAQAQTRLAARGRPPADWATMLLVGDGAMTVAPQAVRKSNRFERRSAMAALGALALLLFLLLVHHRYRGRRSR